MSEYYYKLFQKEAEKLARKLGISLPKTRKELGVKNNEFVDVLKKGNRTYLNKCGTIWIQPCHYYDGSDRWPANSEPFAYEIAHATTEGAFTRFMNENHVPVRDFTY